MELSPLEVLLRDTKATLIAVKDDGKLTPAEIVKVAVELSQKVQAFSALTLLQKEALIHMCLSQGVSAAGGLVAQEHVLMAAVGAANALRDAIPAPVQSFLLSWIPFCSVTQVIETMAPKDAALVDEAVRCFQGATDLSGVTLRVNSQPEKTAETSQVSVVQSSADQAPQSVPKENTPLLNTPSEAPSQPASESSSQ